MEGILNERTSQMNTKKSLNGPEMQEKEAQNIPKLTKAKVKALELISKYPEKPKLEIGRELVRLGLICKADNIYQMTRADRDNGYMQGEIEQIRQLNAARLSKNIVPLALKETERALKDKKYDREKKFKWSKLALDKEYGTDESKRPVYPVNVNVDQIQAIIFKSLTDKLEDKEQD